MDAATASGLRPSLSDPVMVAGLTEGRPLSVPSSGVGVICAGPTTQPGNVPASAEFVAVRAPRIIPSRRHRRVVAASDPGHRYRGRRFPSRGGYGLHWTRQ